MSTTRRKSYNNYNSIPKSARPRSKKSKNSKHKTYVPAHSPRLQHQRYSHQSLQPINNDYKDNLYPDDLDLEDRPTHKKSAVSSFLSIISSKVRRRDSTLSDTIDHMSDHDLLKRMKRRILEILTKLLETKRLKKVKAELKSEVWDREYHELKKRLSGHEIHTRVMKKRLASARSLANLSSLHSNENDEDDDEDVREMATFLLQEYFDEPTTSNTIKAPPPSVPIKQKSAPYYVDNNDNDNGSDMDTDESYDEHEPPDIDNHNGSKHKKRKKNKKKIKYAKRHKDSSGNQSDGVIGVVIHRRASHLGSTAHKYSPRPTPSIAFGYGHIPDKSIILHDPHVQSVQKDRKSKRHRLEIRNKFRRGVRKAMLVNAWSGFIANETQSNHKKRVSLSLSNLDSGMSVSVLSDKMNPPESKSQSPSYSMLFNNFLSDNLIVALSKVGTWEFDPFVFFDTPEIGGKGLVYSVWYLFDQYDVFKLFPSVSPKKFMRFLQLVEDGYLDNPYHNKIHATDVVSNVAYYLNNTQFFEKHVSLFDKFTAILSAAVHDLGHDGNNNAYHITTMSDLAVTYNDISVLENYHIASTFKILKRSDCNWYKSLSKPVQKYLRLAMIDIVLATDMKFHNKKLAQLTNLVAILKQQLCKKILLREDRDSIVSTISTISNASSTNMNILPLSPIPRLYNHSDSSYNIPTKLLSDFPLYKYKGCNDSGVEKLLKTEIKDVVINDSDARVIDVNDERRFILCFLVHLCDISNCAKSLNSGKKWAVGVMTEFFKQGDRERALGLEVSAMMDRRRSSTPQGQIGFIKFILRPSYEMFVRLVPEASKPLEILNENLEFWQIQQKLMTQERKKRARSVGSIHQCTVLMMMQEQLEKLAKKNSDHIEDIMEGENEDDSSEKSEEMHNNIIKHVGFKEQLVIERYEDHEDHDDDDTVIMDNDSEIMVETPRTLSSRSLNISLGMTKLRQSSSHHVTEPSSGSTYIGHSSNISRNTNISIDSLGGDGTPRSAKLRAHSIHVSIPTSDKQIQCQPQPFSEIFAEIRRDWEQKEDEKYQREQNRRKRREKTTSIILMKVQHNHKSNTPKVKQSVSVPVEQDENQSVVAQISVSDGEEQNININNNNNNNKQVFDVV